MIKLLIVDDEEDLALMLKTRFESINYLVMTAKDGLDGLDKARAYNPDIIILDVHMPRMDGYRFLEELRKSDLKARHAAVIVLTARKKMKEAFNPDTISDFIEKPFDAAALVQKVNRIADTLKKQKGTLCRALVIGLDWEAMRPIKSFLESREMLVFTATNGARALELAVQHKPDIVFCASAIGGMDVFSLCKLFKDMPSSRQAPFVVYDTAGQLGARGRETVKAACIIDYDDHTELLAKIDDYLKEFFSSR